MTQKKVSSLSGWTTRRANLAAHDILNLPKCRAILPNPESVLAVACELINDVIVQYAAILADRDIGFEVDEKNSGLLNISVRFVLKKEFNRRELLTHLPVFDSDSGTGYPEAAIPGRLLRRVRRTLRSVEEELGDEQVRRGEMLAALKRALR